MENFLRTSLTFVLAITLLLSINIVFADEPNEISLQAEWQTEQIEALKHLEEVLPEKINDGKQYLIEHPERFSKTRSAALGLVGQILVTTDSSSSSSAGIMGHAAIVSSNSAYTIESYGAGYQPSGYASGVQRYTNTWGNKSGVYLLDAKHDTSLQCTSAASTASGYIGKPYNVIFSNKTTTTAFYCSQLVWRAWKSVGVDIDDADNGTSPVWPPEIVSSKNTIVLEYRP